MPALADDLSTFPAAPRQLRRVRGYYRLFQHHVMLLFLLMFAHVFWTTGSGMVKLYFFSVNLAGQVTRTWTTPGARGPSHFIAVAYRYEGTDYEQEMSITDQEAIRFKQGAAVPLQLLPERPDRPQLYREQYPYTFVTIMGALMAAGPCLAVVRMLWLLYVAPWRLRCLMRTGAATLGTIVERKEQAGRPATYTLTYEFQPPTALGEHRATAVRATMLVEHDVYQATPVGAQAIVLYNPEHPRQSVLAQYGDYEVKSNLTGD